MLLIASMHVSGQILPRNERFSKTCTAILAYFNAVETGNSPSHEAYIKMRQAIHVVQVNDGQVSGAQRRVGTAGAMDADADALGNPCPDCSDDDSHETSSEKLAEVHPTLPRKTPSRVEHPADARLCT